MMQFRRGPRFRAGWFLICAVIGGALGPLAPAVAQEATPASAGEPIRSISRQAFAEQLNTAFALEAPGQSGGTVVIGEATDITTLNGLLASDDPTLYITSLIYETLVAGSPIDGQPAPGLADSWEIAPDGVTYTFTLNPAATWHDGTDVTADDVVFTLDALLNPDTGSVYTGTVAAIVATYRAVDADTVEIVSTGPSATFLIDLYLPVMPKHIWEAVPAAEWASDPASLGQDPARVVGTGPFVFREWVQGDHITLARNDAHYATAPAIDEVVFRVLPDDASAVQALEAGEIDILPGLPPAEIERLSATDGLTVASYDTFNFDFYMTNLDPAQTTLFQDARVRHALYIALDRDAIVEEIYFGQAEPAVGTQPVLSIAYAPEQITTLYPYDPEAAQALLAEAGWTDSDGDGILDKDGQTFSFELITYDGSPTVEQTVVYLQDAWGAIGVEMTPLIVEFPALIETIAGTHDFDVALLGLSWDVTANQDAVFGCDQYPGGFNVMMYCNSRFGALDEQQRREVDPAKRLALLIEQTNVVNDDLPVGILAFLKGSTASNARLHNFHPNAYSLVWSLAYVWIET